jgi:hypothetical protein
MLVTLAFGCATAHAWSLVQVGPHERSLEITYGQGACETLAAHSDQGPRMVAISVSVERAAGDEPCPAILLIRTVTIVLSEPLAGRHVQGSAGPAEDRLRLRPSVPRLVGLAPPDAKFVLSGLRLHAVLHVAARTHGLPRVVSQSPAAGTRVPKNKLVRINILA